MKKMNFYVPLLSIFMVLSSGLLGCAPDNTPVPTVNAKATSVTFNDSGEYTTTLSGYDFNDVKSTDINVSCMDGDDAKYVEVIGAEHDGKKLILNFKDPTPYKNDLGAYSITTKDKKVASMINVDDIEYALESDLKELDSSKESHKITLTLNDNKFNNNITKEQIKLGGSILKSEIVSVSNSEKNLTVIFNGKITKAPVINIYEDATITVLPEAIKNCRKPMSVTLPVISHSIYFDPASLVYINGDVHLTCSLEASYDPMTITKEDFVFEKNVIVRQIVNHEDDVHLILAVPGSKDANSAAKILDGQTIKIRDTICTLLLPDASFYPVFDSIKKDGDNFDVDLTIYSENGRLNPVISVDDIVFDKDLSKASNVSINSVEDNIAKLSFTIPNNGQTLEEFHYIGGITLKSGSLFNSWNDASSEYRNEREYSNNSKGKPLIEAFTVIAGLVSIGLGIASIACEKYDASHTDYGLSTDETIKKFNEVSGKIDHAKDQLTQMLQVQTELIVAQTEIIVEAMRQESARNKVSHFCEIMFETLNACKEMRDLENRAIMELGVTFPDTNKDKAAWDKVQNDITAHIEEGYKKDEGPYRFYKQINEKIHENLTLIAQSLVSSGLDNPIDAYDYLCASSFNFSSQAEESRRLFRYLVSQVLFYGLADVLTYLHFDGTGCDFIRKLCVNAANKFDESCKALNFNKTDDIFFEVYLYGPGVLVSVESSMIGASLDAGSSLARSSGGIIGFETDSLKDWENPKLNFTNAQLQMFAIKMNGRNIVQELTNAKFKIEDIPADQNLILQSKKIVDGNMTVLFRGRGILAGTNKMMIEYANTITAFLNIGEGESATEKTFRFVATYLSVEEYFADN